MGFEVGLAASGQPGCGQCKGGDHAQDREQNRAMNRAAGQGGTRDGHTEQDGRA